MVNASDKPQNVDLGAMPRAILFAEEIANAVADRLLRRRLGVGERNGERGAIGGARSAVTLETLTVQRGREAETELLMPLG